MSSFIILSGYSYLFITKLMKRMQTRTSYRTLFVRTLLVHCSLYFMRIRFLFLIDVALRNFIYTFNFNLRNGTIYVSVSVIFFDEAMHAFETMNKSRYGNPKEVLWAWIRSIKSKVVTFYWTTILCSQYFTYRDNGAMFTLWKQKRKCLLCTCLFVELMIMSRLHS